MNCPNGYYGSLIYIDNDDNTNRCKLCTIGCLICIGASTNCTNCGNVTNVIYYKDLNTNTCNIVCPAGQYIDALVPNSCVRCSD